jgi:8-oxo-dGTP pyrophosphatase MutT (NUDIX family)
MQLDPVVMRNACFWIALPVSMAYYLSTLLDCGFIVHHATQLRFLLVTRSTQETITRASEYGRTPSPDKLAPTVPTKTLRVLPIPEYGTHYCRAECIVVHFQSIQKPSEPLTLKPFVLMVKERFGKLCDNDSVGRSYGNTWKYVSGTVHSGEFFTDAAEREIREETGIASKFYTIVGIANKLQTRFLRDELTICLLFLTNSIGPLPALVKDEEILDAAWIPFDCVHVALSENNNVYTAMACNWLLSATGSVEEMAVRNTTRAMPNNTIAYGANKDAASFGMGENILYDRKTKRHVRNYFLSHGTK